MLGQQGTEKLRTSDVKYHSVGDLRGLPIKPA